jgi:hypothetical protein
MKVVPFVIGALLVSGPALAADFSGSWSITAQIGGKPAPIQCTLVQKGDALTGSCKPAQFDPSPLTGTVAKSSAKWGYDVVFNGNKNHVEYEAMLGADGKLAGIVHLGPMPVPFIAVKQ